MIILSQFIGNLGVKSKHGFVDVFGFDDDLLCMVPQPVYALLLLFPCSEKVGNKIVKCCIPQAFRYIHYVIMYISQV